MVSFPSFRDQFYQSIKSILHKVFPCYISSPVTDSIIPHLPNEIITEILLRLPPKSLSKFMCVSKSWNQLISSPHFVKNHLKLNSHHRVLFRGIKGIFKFYSLPPLFYKEQETELFHVDSPIANPESTYIVGSVNGLICVFNRARKTYIWNPITSKSKELPDLKLVGCSYYCNYGFGYDESHDDYKALFIGFSRDSFCNVVNIYSLRTDSWRTLHEQLQGIFLLNLSGKFVNGKLYWTSSTDRGNYGVCNIICFDLAEETWRSLELPICGEDNARLGVVGSDLSLLYICGLGTTTSDVWIMKDYGINVSWEKLFTIKHPQDNVGLHMCSLPIYTFSIHFCQSNKGEILLLLSPFIMMYDSSTSQAVCTDVKEWHADVEGCNPAEIYVESLVDPLLIADPAHRNHETSQSFS